MAFGHSLLSLAGRGRKTGNRGAWYTWPILPRKEDRECHARFHFHAGTIIIVPVCYATWHFRTPRLRRALDPACTRANYRKSDFFFSFSLSFSFSLYFFLLTSVEFLRCSPRVKVLRSSYTRKLVRGESVFTSTFWKSVSGGIESDS